MIARVLSMLLLVLGVLGLSEATAEVTAPGRKLALVAPIRGTVDLGLGPFVERVLRQAKEQRAEVVILDIDTFGGRVDAAVAIRDTLSSVSTSPAPLRRIDRPRASAGTSAVPSTPIR